jgi:hypothetical protein
MYSRFAVPCKTSHLAATPQFVVQMSSLHRAAGTAAPQTKTLRYPRAAAPNMIPT